MDDIDLELFTNIFGNHSNFRSEEEVARFLLGDMHDDSDDDDVLHTTTQASEIAFEHGEPPIPNVHEKPDDHKNIISNDTTRLSFISISPLHSEPVAVIPTPCNLDNFRVKNGAYTGVVQPSNKGAKDPLTLEDALGLGLKLVKHDSRTTLITDVLGRIIVALIPPPQGDVDIQAAKDAFLSMKEMAHSSVFQSSDYFHKRGRSFVPINAGLSYGIGHTIPSFPKLSLSKQKAADAFVRSKPFQQLASRQNKSFAKWHPRAYQYYRDELSKLSEHHPELPLPLFPDSVMPTATFNLGYNVFTKRHLDSQNCPFGWCLITALGDFDASMGGHIILWDLGLIIEFPAGSCVCIPSALLMHSNIPAAGCDQRMSFTQYCPGEIFRYIENWFLTDGQLMDISPAAMQYNLLLRSHRKTHGFDMFLNVDEILLST